MACQNAWREEDEEVTKAKAGQSSKLKAGPGEEVWTLIFLTAGINLNGSMVEQKSKQRRQSSREHRTVSDPSSSFPPMIRKLTALVAALAVAFCVMADLSVPTHCPSGGLTGTAREQIIFIDSRVPDLQKLLGGVKAGAQVVML